MATYANYDVIIYEVTDMVCSTYIQFTIVRVSCKPQTSITVLFRHHQVYIAILYSHAQGFLC
jgi:hypothetical protein